MTPLAPNGGQLHMPSSTPLSYAEISEKYYLYLPDTSGECGSPRMGTRAEDKYKTQDESTLSRMHLAFEGTDHEHLDYHYRVHDLLHVMMLIIFSIVIAL
ncbi:hypothetical protein N7478_010323 [Penicillium angulare]|uniref:uncharacterized protein n=1 Tax=Penicillium angulare TaxID=116970 RepID=UPI0025424074|nr:uncharacterized protein N7478_010323 [Penicillium angulare]KAJ5267515.1 hypothetical protein N7478_010323 [Penicillium angulare]